MANSASRNNNFAQNKNILTSNYNQHSITTLEYLSLLSKILRYAIRNFFKGNKA
jgi:hypothetical protein